jgi:putative peptide zinc metalloprotease protein
VTGSGLAAAILLLFVVPVNNSTRAEGIIRLPENTELRTLAGGFVAAVHKLDGDAVSPGELIIRLVNPELEKQEAVLSAQARELSVRYNTALSGEPVELEILRREIAANEAELREAREQLVHLEIQRVVIPQDDVDRVRRRTREIEVRLASRQTETVVGERLRDVPKATSELPSALLGSREGGDIAVDARDTAGRRATRPVFQLEIALPARPGGPYLGQRGYVRFEHFREPVGRVWWRQLRQKVLSELGI